MEIGFHTGETVKVSLLTQSANNMARVHSHRSYELYYLSEGARYLFVGDLLFEVRAGDIFLIPPGLSHRTLDAGEGGYTRLTCNIPPSLIPRCELLPAGIHLSRPEGEAAARLRALSAVASGEEALSAWAACLEMLSLALSLPHTEALAPGGSPSLSRVAEIVGYIDRSFAEQLTLTYLSEKFFISEYYLCRLFKQYTGTTIHSYVNSLRLSYSRRLLSEGATVERASKECGFGSVSAFRTAYRKQFGIPPRAERRCAKNPAEPFEPS